MSNVKQEFDSNRAFMDVVGDFSDLGFKFSTANEHGVQMGLPYSPSKPSAVLVADPAVMSCKLPHVIACLYEDAPAASYLHLAVKSSEMTEQQLSEISRLGGFLFPILGSDTAYGFIPLKTVAEDAGHGYGPQYEKDLLDLFSALSKLSLPTVPYPCTSDALSVLPMFGDHAFERITNNVAAPILSQYFGSCMNVLKMPPELQDLVEQQTMQRAGISQVRVQEPTHSRMVARA